MKCDVCEKEATVFLTQIINGQMTTVNLCEGCSKAKGVTDEMGFGLAEAFLSPAKAGVPIKAAPQEDIACPACGFTQAQLKKIGRMGCPECYGTFREGLDSLLKSMHKGTKHIGKVPRRQVTEAKTARTATSLREELDRAVKEERYEDAAKLKAEMENSGGK